MFSFNIFIILFSNKNEGVFLEGCSLSNLSIAFLVMLFFSSVIHTSIQVFGQSYISNVSSFFMLYCIDCLMENVEKIPRTITFDTLKLH